MSPSPSRRCLLFLLLAQLLFEGSGSCAERASPANATTSLTEGLSLYMPFDDQATPKFCRGKPDVSLGGAFVGQGRVNGGINVIGTASVSILSMGNFYRPRGSIAFWHKPDWNPIEDLKGHRVMLKEAIGNFQIIWFGPKRILFFMTGTSQFGKGFKWDYSVASKEPMKWKPGEWHHLAITWDSATGQKRLYLDGRVASEGKTSWLRDSPSRIDANISLGSPSAQGAYDEWIIWDRVLSSDEVALLAERPEDAAKLLGTKEPTEKEKSAPLRFELVPIQPPAAVIVEPNQKMLVPSLVRNLTGKPLNLDLRLSLVDPFDKVLSQWTRRLTLAAEAKDGETVAFTAKTHRLGAFKIRAEFDWEGKTYRRDVGGFAVWPKAYCKPSPDSFFGHHVTSWHGGAFIRQAERLGLSWVRNHDMLQTTWMNRAMPEPGAPKWMFADHIEAYRKAGVSILGNLAVTPYWAVDPRAPKPKDRGFPRGLKPRAKEFERYVRMTLKRYGKTIRVWEVWNEPSVSHSWSSTPEEFGALAKLVCRTVKEVDPTAKVFVGGFTAAVPREWYERVAKNGAFESCDGISFHGYTGGGDSPAMLPAKIDLMRGLAREFAPRGENTELWDSEWGIVDTTFYVDAEMKGLPPRRLLPSPSYLEGAARAVKENALKMGFGIGRSFFYLHNVVTGPDAYHGLSSMEFTHAPRPKLMALVAMEHLTRGYKPGRFIDGAKTPGLRALVLSRGPADSLAVVWLEKGAKSQIPDRWGEGTKLFDLFSNPMVLKDGFVEISEVPVYIRAPLSAAELANRLHHQE